MADAESNIRINIDTADALAELQRLQRQLSAFQVQMARGSAQNKAAAANVQQDLINNINATGKYTANIKTIQTSSEAFTTALEKNKLALGEYFKYAAASTTGFRNIFSKEFNTIEKVARDRVKTLQTQYVKLGRDANGAMRAMAVRPLMLDMDNLATKTAVAVQKQQIFNQLLKQGSTQLLNFGKNTQWAGRQLMVGFTVPLTMLGTTAAKTFMDMEKQVIRFKRVYGDMFTSSGETDRMVKDIQRLGREFTKYGVAVADTMEMAADAAAMGKQGIDLIAQVNQATRLAVLGGVEQKDALETTISLTNAFGVAADDLANKINFLNSVENQTVTSIEDLTVAVPKAGPVIQQLGGDVEDLAFFLTAMKEGGINASEGANALKSGLASMINPTKSASEFMAKFGISIQGIVEANKGDVKGMVMGLAQSLDKLDPLNRARAIEQMFGKFQFARLSTLFQNVVKDGSQASRVLDMTKSSTEEFAIVAERELKRVESSPMYKFQKSIENIKTALVPLGEAFLKVATPFVEFGTKLLEKFNSLDEGAKNFVIGVTAVLGVIGPAAIMAFGLLANGVANIIKGFTFLKNVFSRAEASSRGLTEGIDYLTQQQLEGISIANSLEGAHQNLTAQFTSEVGAINQLIDAYNRALIAQNQLMPGQFTPSNVNVIPGGKPNVNGYSNGVFSVPGPKGAGDVVPAMLTPGEAVIPADKTEKYAPLISGIIADNIPGFSKGNAKGGSTVTVGNANFSVNATSDKAAQIEQEANKFAGSVDNGGDIVAETLRRLGSDVSVSVESFRQELIVVAKEMSGMALRDTLMAALPTQKAGEDAAARIRGNRSDENIRDQFIRERGAKGSAEVDAADSAVQAEIAALRKLITDRNAALPEDKRLSPASLETEIQKKIKNSIQYQEGTNYRGLARGHIEQVGDTGKLSSYGFHSDVTSAVTRKENQLSAMMIDDAKSKAQGKTVTSSNYNDVMVPGMGDAVKSGVIAQQEADAIDAKIKSDLSLTNDEMIAQGKVIEHILANRRDLLDNATASFEENAVLVAAGARDRRKFAGQGVGDRTAEERKRGQSNIKQELNRGTNEFVATADLAPGQELQTKKGNAIVPGSGKVAKSAEAVGSAIPQGVAAGIDQASPAVVAATGEMADESIQTAKDKLQIHSPSKKFFEIGKNVARGFTDGVRSSFSEVSGTMDQFEQMASPKDAFSSDSYVPPPPLSDPFADPNASAVDWNAGQKKSLGERIGEKATKSAGLFGKKIADGALSGLEKGWMAVAGKKLARAQGAVITGRNGEVIYDGSDSPTQEPANFENADSGAAMDNLMMQAMLEDKVRDKLGYSGDLTPEQQARVDKKVARQGRFGNMKGKLSPIGPGGTKLAGLSMLLNSATMAASMIPGDAGQKVQEFMGPLMTAFSLLPMITSPMGAVVIAATAVIGTMMMLKGAFDEAQQKAIKYAETMKASSKAMEAIAEFGGKATASSIMKRRRDEAKRELGAAPGKTTYGEAFVKSDAGKQIVSALAEANANKGKKQASKDLFSQMSTAVLSGAMTAAQAESMALNIAKEAGDMSIGIEVVGKMDQIFGPNGENLEKDPLTVRMRMVADQQKQVGSSFKAAGDNTGKGFGTTGGQFGAVALGAGVGAGLAGAGIAAIAGGALGATAAGAVAGSVVPVIGTLVGLAAGAVAAGFMIKDQVEKAGKFGAAAAVDAKIAVEQNAELLSSMDIYYQKKIDELTVQGKINEAQALQLKYMEDRNKLTGAMKQTAVGFMNSFNADSMLQEAINSGAKKSTDAKFKDNPDELAYVDVVRAQTQGLKDSGTITEAQKVWLEVKMASDLPPSAQRQLLGLASGDKKVEKVVVDMMVNMSGSTATDIGSVAALLDDKNRKKFVLKVGVMADGDALDYTKNIMALTRLEQVIPANVGVKVILENEDVYNQLNKLLDAIELDSPKTLTALYKIMPQIGDGKEQDMAAWEEKYFGGLSENQKKVFSTTLATQIVIPDPAIIASPDYKTWLGETIVVDGQDWGGKQFAGAKFSDSYRAARYRMSQAQTVTASAPALAPTGDAPAGSTTGGGGPTASPLDDLLKKLRDVRKNQVKVTEGFDASAKALNQLFGNGKQMTTFSGIEQDMRKLGAGEDLIGLIVGMDPKEYEKQKKKLFEFDKAGNIAKFKGTLKSIGQALREIALGDFQTQQGRVIAEINTQDIAARKLWSSGMDLADAYSTVEDKALAAAIASKEITKVELSKIISDANRAAAAMEKLAAAQAIAKTYSAENKDSKAEAALSAESDRIRAMAIGSDKELMDLYTSVGGNLALLTKQEAATFQARLLQVMNGKEFRKQLFDEGMDKAMNRFSVLEEQLRIKMEIDTTSTRNAIEDVTNQIAAINYKIDDQEAALQQISDQEEDINKSYEDRFKALDKIQRANEEISRQQKSQLGLADALSRGDIAAAAAAAQEMRSQSAEDSINEQRRALEKTQQEQINALVAENGKTKIEIETELKRLRKEVFNLEEKQLEPAQEAIRQAEYKLAIDTRSLTVNGKTKLEWDQMANQVAVAAASSQEYLDAIQAASEIQSQVVADQNAVASGSAVDRIDYASSVASATAAKTTADAALAAEQAAIIAKKPVIESGVNTGGSSGGTGGGGSKTDSTKTSVTKTTTTTTPTDTTGTSVSPTTTAGILDSLKAAESGRTTADVAKRSMSNFYAAQNALKSFKGSSGKNYGDVFSKGSSSIKNLKDLEEYEKLVSTMETAKKSLSARGFSYVPSSKGDFETVVGTAEWNFSEKNMNSITSATRGMIKSADISRAEGNLPAEVQWLSSRGPKFAKLWANFTDDGRGGNNSEMQRAFDAAGISRSIPISEVMSNPTAKAKLVKAYKSVFGGSDDHAVEMINQSATKMKAIFDGFKLGQKNRLAAKAMGYSSSSLKSYFNGDGNVLEENQALTPTKVNLFTMDKIREIGQFATGGFVSGNNSVAPRFALGTDSVPAMLTPGEFVMKKYAVEKYGVDNMKAINNGTFGSSPVYNSYDINVNVKSDSNPDQIARAVMTQIKQLDSQRLRGSRI